MKKIFALCGVAALLASCSLSSSPEMSNIKQAADNVQAHLIGAGLETASGYDNARLMFPVLEKQVAIVEENAPLVPEEEQKKALDYLISLKVFYAAEFIERAYAEDKLEEMRATIADTKTLLAREDVIAFLEKRGGQAAIARFVGVIEQFEKTLTVYLDENATEDQFLALEQTLSLEELFDSSQALINAGVIYGGEIELIDEE